MVHLPTGLSQTAVGRVKQNNLDEARSRLIQMLDDRLASQGAQMVNHLRSEQIGSGMRGDKIRTYRFQDDQIHDHRTDRKTTCKRFMRGDLESLWR
jgi:peptide chain release factor 1